ncbi:MULTISPECIES: LLM class flavin-dependent oxidoreductase [Actinoalloteichus]|uniref:Flavin-dependent oxidoreductase, luciferase family (Includes alkanesulfonate monooxygenase SsuD and methylene tetrahydromethanopterin reductase) n=1 Tax=Actinoalloteichus caeruleus DSM 43889 TaxID=1120930 RepID=A0ABT1JMN1_ACTCY|nr:LLM class flavin-dependent oxidoreductase [Actinoalloteichus caeruleus]MCP2333789.1 Flavin-dependent oxidoreductase, luciferase family (includes alkanesulfonate monooxygenase SsuD and methylene tetrahydromethanopterin reductase) [Actinoalloteichus caeruleus DSM 43889]
MKLSIFSVTDHHPSLGRSISDFYDQLLDEIELADQLGFANYFVAEHHFHEYGVVTSPPVLLAAAARRTNRIGLGAAVAVLPFHNPLVLAEEYAMLDQLSGGRLALGVGSGYLEHEYAGFGIGNSEKRVRFDEALEVLTKAWTGEPVTYHGHYHHVDDVRIAVTPLAPPPLWVAVIRAEAAYHVGRQGRNVMLIPYATATDISDLGTIVDSYRRGYAESGAPGRGEVAVALHTYVGDRPDVRSEVGPALAQYTDSRLYHRSRRSYDQLTDAGLVLFGDQDEVRERVEKLSGLGVGHLLALTNFGGMPSELANASLRRLSTLLPTADERDPV